MIYHAQCSCGAVRLEADGGRCQTNSNHSQFAANSVNLSGTKLAPLGKSGGACHLEDVSTCE